MTVNDLLNTPLTSPVLAFILTSVGAIAAYFLRPRVRLVWAQSSVFLHRMQPGTEKEFTINTASYIIVNAGRASAKNVEFVLNYKADELSIWNQRQYTIEVNPEGRQIIKFSDVAPKETITVNLISIGKNLPSVLNLRNADRIGKMVEVYPQQKLSKALILFFWLLIICGAFFLIKLAVSLALQFAHIASVV